MISFYDIIKVMYEIGSAELETVKNSYSNF